MDEEKEGELRRYVCYAERTVHQESETIEVEAASFEEAE